MSDSLCVCECYCDIDSACVDSEFYTSYHYLSGNTVSEYSEHSSLIEIFNSTFSDSECSKFDSSVNDSFTWCFTSSLQ